MTQNTITVNLNPETDPLAHLEARIRADGVWCRKVKDFGLRHKMICRRSRSNIAISLCGQVIVQFDKLVEDTETKKCLVCDLYDGAREEVKLKAEKTLKRIVDQMS